MIKVKTKEIENEIISFLIELKEIQKDISETEQICYPKLSLYLAIKNKIFFKNLLLHPVILVMSSVYGNKEKIKESELELLLLKTLEYEFTESQVFLIKPEIDTVIKVHKRLKNKREKNESVNSFQTI